MQPLTSRIIHSLRQTLTQRIGPRLMDRDAQALIAIMDFALTELLHRAEDRDELLRASNARSRALLLRGHDLLGIHAEDLSASSTTGAGSEELIRESDGLRIAASKLINRLPFFIHGTNDPKTQPSKHLVREILREQLQETLAELAPVPRCARRVGIQDPDQQPDAPPTGMMYSTMAMDSKARHRRHG